MAGLLASAMSGAESLRRNLLDFVKDPMARIERSVGQTQDYQRELGDLYRQGYDAEGNVINPDAANAFNTAMANMAANMSNVAGATVWHGSPYKFERFDPTKIGSGEGAQAYGYGHYVAQNPSVANEYQQTLREIGYSYDGQKIDKLKNPVTETAAKLLYESGGNKKVAIRAADRYAYDDLLKKEIEKLNPNKVSIGNLYKIDLPDDQIAKMLNWDQELGKQSPEIQALAKQHGLSMDDLGGDLVAAMDAKRAAGAEAMRQAGVPGIKYFDAQSRGGQKADTQNFVVFPGNEGLLNILERNNQPIKSLLDVAPEQKLYRVEDPSYSNPNVGAVFYSPDKKYVDLYNSEGRLMREASMPEGVLDIRNKNDAKSIIKWVDKEYQNMLNEYDNGLPLGDEIKTIGNILRNKNPSTDEIGQALANITIGKWKMGYPRVSGIAEKELMDALDKDAMTMIEAGTQDKNNFSVAFRSSDIAKKYWKK